MNPPLEPETQYRIVHDVFVPPAVALASREAVVEWVDACVLGDLRTLRLGIQARERLTIDEQNRFGGCNFLLAASCCMALEYLGLLYAHGSDATARVRRYVQDFLAQIEPRYLQVFPIFWTCYRNGLAHGSWPQYVSKIGERGLRVAVGANTNYAGEHLAPAGESKGPSFTISTVRLLDDIEASFRGRFKQWILEEADAQVLERAGPRLHLVANGNSDGNRAFEFIAKLNDKAG